jgi:DNA repair protein RecO
MGLYKTEGIVLRSINLAETDKLVTFMTEKYGKLKCVAKSARKLKSRFAASLEPMSCIHLIFFGKEGQVLYRLNTSDIIESFQSVRDDFGKLYTGIYFNELIDVMVPEMQRESKIFQLLKESLETLARGNSLETLRRVFEMRLLALSGYTPHLDQCVRCKGRLDDDWVGFSYHRNGIVCTSCAGGVHPETRLKAGTLNYLRKLLTLDIKNSGRLKFPRGLDEEIGSITHRLILAHTGRELNHQKNGGDWITHYFGRYPWTMTKQTINTDQAPAAIGPYAQAVQTGEFLFTSGQIALDPATGGFLAGEIEMETEQTLKNLAAILEAAGLTLENVVKTTVYLADLNHFARMNAVYEKAFGTNKPARACVQVAALPKGAKVEIDAVAAFSIK